MMGQRWAWKGIFLYFTTVLLLILGFGVGLGFKFLVEPSSYWQTYVLPDLLFQSYIDNIANDAPLYKYILALPIGFLDCIRVYVHFNFERGGLALWIPEIMSFICIRNFWKIILA
jgi:hypothetical protein